MDIFFGLIFFWSNIFQLKFSHSLLFPKLKTLINIQNKKLKTEEIKLKSSKLYKIKKFKKINKKFNYVNYYVIFLIEMSLTKMIIHKK